MGTSRDWTPEGECTGLFWKRAPGAVDPSLCRTQSCPPNLQKSAESFVQNIASRHEILMEWPYLSPQGAEKGANRTVPWSRASNIAPLAQRWTPVDTSRSRYQAEIWMIASQLGAAQLLGSPEPPKSLVGGRGSPHGPISPCEFEVLSILLSLWARAGREGHPVCSQLAHAPPTVWTVQSHFPSCLHRNT